LRQAVLAGVDAVSDGATVDVNGHRLPIAAPAGPVIVLGVRAKDGLYRAPISMAAATVLPGTRHGRALRLAANITRAPAIAALAISFALAPLLAALLTGATIAG
jgi:hypothetical protein